MSIYASPKDSDNACPRRGGFGARGLPYIEDAHDSSGVRQTEPGYGHSDVPFKQAVERFFIQSAAVRTKHEKQEVVLPSVSPFWEVLWHFRPRNMPLYDHSGGYTTYEW